MQYENHCIKFFPEKNTWNGARDICHAFKGDLVSIHDVKKQTFVYDNLAVGKTLWIGLKRDDKYASKFGVKSIMQTDSAVNIPLAKLVNQLLVRWTTNRASPGHSHCHVVSGKTPYSDRQDKHPIQ